MKILLLILYLTFIFPAIADDSLPITKIQTGTKWQVLTSFSIPGGDWAIFSQGKFHERFISHPEDDIPFCKIALSTSRYGYLIEDEIIGPQETIKFIQVTKLYPGMEALNFKRSDNKIVTILCNSFSADGKETVPTISEVKKILGGYFHIP